ncbi:MAG: iron ABC transporter permease [Sulfurospirillaceae bacterium]|nr:iron ABC transporter permease [Sulfurospirillaceae bacterium]MDD3462103.1 iron ABC transporter permease [Sulfurospirillaceae bacterium]
MSLAKSYEKRAKKRLLTTAFLLSAMVALFWLALISGSGKIIFSDTFRILNISTCNDNFAMIIEAIRAPRAFGAILVGMLLGLSGVTMQGVLKNPLASPFTLGISQAAGFGASLAIVVFEPNAISNPFMSKFVIAFLAFSTSILCMFVIVWIGRKVAMIPSTLILSGVALGSLFHAGTMFLQYFTTEINASATLFWTFGDLSKATYENLWLLLLVLVVSMVVLWSSHWKFDALGFGDESAFNKGVNVKNFRSFALIFSALCTAIAVAFFGIIGFIGLVAPHLVRLFLGNSHVALIPLSALSGGVLLLGADLLSRMLFYPSVLPVGILTSFIGAPMLLYLLASKGKIR